MKKGGTKEDTAAMSNVSEWKVCDSRERNGGVVSLGEDTNEGKATKSNWAKGGRRGRKRGRRKEKKKKRGCKKKEQTMEGEGEHFLSLKIMLCMLFGSCRKGGTLYLALVWCLPKSTIHCELTSPLLLHSRALTQSERQ
jgi:hypothetical protein